MPCFKIGAESALSNPNVQGIWFKTHVVRKADHLVATTFLVSNGDIQVFKAEVDLGAIARSLKASDAVGAWYNPIDQAKSAYSKVSRLGKSKLARQVWNTTKDAVNSNITRGLVAATAVVFPPVGVPALAALASATAAVAAIEEGRKAAHGADKLVQRLGADKRQKAHLDRFALKHGKPALEKYLGKNPDVVTALNKGQALRAKVKEQLTPARKEQLLKVLRKSSLAKTFLKNVNDKAKFGQGQEKVEAKKMKAVVMKVVETRAKVKSLTQEMKGGIPGILIDANGALRGGLYVSDPRSGTMDVLVTPTGMRPGTYKAIKLDPEKVERLKQLQAQVKKAEALNPKVNASKSAPKTNQQKAKAVKASLDSKSASKAKILAKVKALPPAEKKKAVASITSKLKAAQTARTLKVQAVKSKISALPPAKKAAVKNKLAKNLAIVNQVKAQRKFSAPKASFKFH